MALSTNTFHVREGKSSGKHLHRRVARRILGGLGFNIILDMAGETLTLLLASNKGADQPAHPLSLIDTFVIHNIVSDTLSNWVRYLLILYFCGGFQHDPVSGYDPGAYTKASMA